MAQQTNHQFKRKKLNLAVKRELQMWLLRRILSVVLVSTLVAVLILYFYARQEISGSFYSAHIQIRRVSDLLFPVMAAGAIVSLISGLILALFLPQRIAGPIFAVQRRLRQLGEGDLKGRVYLRSHDTYLKDLADTINETAEQLQGRIQAIKGAQQELDQILSSSGDRQATAVSARQKEVLEKLLT